MKEMTRQSYRQITPQNSDNMEEIDEMNSEKHTTYQDRFVKK